MKNIYRIVKAGAGSNFEEDWNKFFSLAEAEAHRDRCNAAARIAYDNAALHNIYPWMPSAEEQGGWWEVEEARPNRSA